MKRPKVIIHNSISLDGSLLGFDVDMEEHYRTAGSYGADIHLVGSNTIREGIKMFCARVPEEKKSDFIKPQRDARLPLWVIPDTTGKLQGLHHAYRRFELCRDVVVLVSEKTPAAYLSYLKDRDYDFHVAGKDKVDYRRALELLGKIYRSKTVLTDTGSVLSSILLNEGLVDEISLLVHPVIVGKGGYTLLGGTAGKIKLELLEEQSRSGGKVWLRYKVMLP